MQVQVDEQGRILGYATVGGFVDGIEVDFGAEGMPGFVAGKYLLENSTPVENPDYTPEPKPGQKEPGRDPLTVLQETVDMLVIAALGGGNDA